MIRPTAGNLLDFPANIKVNTVNCVGIMGKGIALAFKERYPRMYRDYKLACGRGEVAPGRLHLWNAEDGTCIVNFPTKRHWRNKSRYDDIEAGLLSFRKFLLDRVEQTVAVPPLGCGNGGLEWPVVKRMIFRHLGDLRNEIYLFEPDFTHAPITDQGDTGTGVGLGNDSLLSHEWTALLSSKSPGDDETVALYEVADSLLEKNMSPVLAMVRFNKKSDDIAEIFISRGVRIVLIYQTSLPATSELHERYIRWPQDQYLIVSASNDQDRWNPYLAARAIDLLRRKSSRALISEPAPKWIFNSGARAWAGHALWHVLYSATPDVVAQQFDLMGVKRLGRSRCTSLPLVEKVWLSTT